MQTKTKTALPIGRIAFSLYWIASLALGFWALYLTVMFPDAPGLTVLRIAAITALVVFVIWDRWLRSFGRIPQTTGVLLMLMPLALMGVHLMLTPHPGIAWPVAVAPILLFESFFRTGGGKA